MTGGGWVVAGVEEDGEIAGRVRVAGERGNESIHYRSVSGGQERDCTGTLAAARLGILSHSALPEINRTI